jgi:3-methyladenine DNA glycosylase AlkD
MAFDFLTFRQTFRAAGDAQRAVLATRFFKTGPGEYGEGDQFLGITVPAIRSYLPQTDGFSEAELLALLHSSWHEERLLALLALGRRFTKAKKDRDLRSQLASLYLANTRWVNNWNLVDTSAPQILGAWLLERDRSVLAVLAASENLWEQRIAIVATWTFIRAGDFADTLWLCERFLAHPHDLMHKACGWMLREVGKREVAVLHAFLDEHAKAMPRTMLRYAIEKLPPAVRQGYMAGGIQVRPGREPPVQRTVRTTF